MLVLFNTMKFKTVPHLGKYLIQIYLTMTILTLIGMSTLFLVMNSRYLGASREEIVRYSKKALDEKSLLAQLVMEQVVSFIIDLYYNTTVSDFLNGASGGSYELNNVVTTIRQRKNSQSFIHSVFVSSYNSEIASSDQSYHEMTINNMTLKELMEHPVDRRITVYPGIFRRSRFAAEEKIISYLFVNRMDTNNGKQIRILVNVFEGSFSLKYSESDMQQGRQFILSNQDGIVISHSDKSLIGSALTSEWIENWNNSNNDIFWKIIEVDHEEMLVVTLENPGLQWRMYDVNPYHLALSRARSIQRDLLVVMLISMLLFLALAVVISSRLYRPVRNLLMTVSRTKNIDEYQGFTNELNFIGANYQNIVNSSQIDSRLIRSQFLRNMLLTELPPEVIAQVAQRINDELPTGEFWLVLFTIDRVKDIHVDDLSLFHYYVSQQIEVLTKEWPAILVPVSLGESIAILHKPNSQEQIFRFCSEVGRTFHKESGYTVTSAITGPIADIVDIHRQYTGIRTLISNAVLTGPGHIHTEEELANREHLNFEYPRAVEKAIINTLKKLDTVNYDQEVESLLTYAIRYDRRRFNFLILQVAMSVLRHINVTFGDTGPESFENFEDLILRIETVNNLEEIKQLYTNLYSHYASLISGDSIKSHTKDQRTIKKIKEYVLSEITNNQLSIELIADHLGYSSGHLSRKFKSQEGTTISEYINTLRFELCCKRLRDTDDNIEEISVSTGFSNVNYFYTAFKHRIGITPTAYRELTRREI